jgi:hypothetical protein
MLLAACRGDEIWSPQTCRQQGVPEAWIEELVDNFESGFRSDRDTIYEAGEITNQYRGVRDLDLAHRLAEFLGVNAACVTQMAISREAEVRSLQEAVEEL